jgi:hypothetical protein
MVQDMNLLFFLTLTGSYFDEAEHSLRPVTLSLLILCYLRLHINNMM